MRVVPFHHAHIGALKRQPEMEWLERHKIDYRCLEGPHSFSVFDRSDDIQACLGLIEHWAGRAEAWALLGEGCRSVLPALHRKIRGYLGECPYNRIDAAVPVEFVAAHRWVRMLGFICEAQRMTAYLPEGRDAALYAKVK